ncbi:hypothetical protein BC629DRAFT_1528858 [Irpex lacteus]|nr:hypothetical protein BC629DRAFT_1528858 [Irpex lacteus]
MVGTQTSSNLLAIDPLGILHVCDASRPPLFLELSLVPRTDQAVSSQASAPLPSGSVPAAMSSHILNSSTLFLGLFTVFTVLAWKARTVRKTVEEVGEESIPSTPVRSTAEYLVNDEPETSTVDTSIDLDDTLDESILLSPTGSGYFTSPSSPKMLTTSEAPSPMLLSSVDSPAFRHIWKSSAIATAEIAHKRRRSSIVAKLQRWAAKRHEQAAQQARSLKFSASVSRESNGSGDGLSSLGALDNQLGSHFGSDRSVSPSAAQKLRFRREGLKTRAREVEVIRAALYNDEL